jgi:hypothetical protein
MRRIRLFSLWEDDFKELAELFKKHKFYTDNPANAEEPRKKAKAGGKARFNELKLAESTGRLMALLAEMGPVRGGPEEFKKAAARKTCAPVEETIARIEAVCKDLAAVR